MVVKVTAIFSNDFQIKLRDGTDKDMFEQIALKQYQEAFNRLVSLGSDPSEEVIVEKCELVKED